MRRRHPLLFAIPTCAAALSLAPVAARADLIPAPPSEASAVAAQVGSLLDVSKTAAAANADTGSADASVVRLGGQPLLGLGGSQTGDGQSSGALLDTGTALPARVQVAPWAAEVHGSHSPTRHAQSSAVVARAAVPDVVDAGVLTSESEATHTDQQSSGTAVTDGFQANVLNAIQLVLLHSEVSSEGQGHSYLLGLNGTEIGTDDQLGASPLCALNAGVLSLSCLTSSGGVGAAAAQVARVTPALDALAMLDPVAAFTVGATSGSGQAAPAAPAPAPTPEANSTLANEASRAVSPVAASTGSGNPVTAALARTGTTVASLAAGAAMLLLLGMAMRRFGLRPATS